MSCDRYTKYYKSHGAVCLFRSRRRHCVHGAPCDWGIITDYFWTGGKFADDTRHDDWSRGVLFSPLLLARDYSMRPERLVCNDGPLTIIITYEVPVSSDHNDGTIYGEVPHHRLLYKLKYYGISVIFTLAGLNY